MKGTSFDKKSGLPYDKKPAVKSGVKGNTLDYYNDDMSRKAVGKLFSETRSDGDVSAGKHSSDYPAEVSDESSEFIDLDELDTYIKKKNVNISSVFDDNSDDEYDISLYQGKKKEGEASASIPKKAPVRSVPSPASKTPPPPVPKHSPVAQAAQVDDKKADRRFKLDSAGLSGNTSPRAAIVSNEINAQIKIAALVIVIVFLAILAALVFKMRSLSASLDEANEIAAKYDPEIESELTQMSIWYQGLKEENDQLRKDLEIARENTAETPVPDLSTNPNSTTTTPPAGQTTAPPTSTVSQTQGDRTHTVARGDNLYAICIQYYKSYSPEAVQKIKNANGLTSDTINPGQILKIPQ